MKEKKLIYWPEKIFGIPTNVFLVFAVLTLACAYVNILPKGLVGQVATIVALAGITYTIGDMFPGIRDVGGRVLLPIFLLPTLKMFGIMPEHMVGNISAFMDIGYMNFYIPAILVGAILPMNRKILIKSTTRYIPTIVISQLFGLLFLGISSLFTSYSCYEAIFYVGAPCMSGGSGGALTTLPATYSAMLGQDVSYLSGQFYAIAVLGTQIALLICIIFKVVAEKFPRHFDNGQGELLRIQDSEFVDMVKNQNAGKIEINYAQLGGGMFTTLVFMIGGQFIAKYFTFLPQLAWTIVLVIVVKLVGILPENVEQAAQSWNRFMLEVGLPILIIGLAVNAVDLQAMMEYCNVSTIVVIVMGILGSIVGAMIGSKIFGLHMYEGAITAALCSCNIGGSGDLQMCAATDRMELLPFATISTRLGGGIMIIWISIIFPFFAKMAGLL